MTDETPAPRDDTTGEVAAALDFADLCQRLGAARHLVVLAAEVRRLYAENYERHDYRSLGGFRDPEMDR